MVTAAQVAGARLLMSPPSRYSMQQAAIIMGVRSSDLDQALWRHLGTPTVELCPDSARWPKPPPPMF